MAVLASRNCHTVDQFEHAGLPLHSGELAAASPRRRKEGSQILGWVAKKSPSMFFPRSLRIGTGPGERIAWVLEGSGGSNSVKTEAKSIATSPPERGAGEQKTPWEVFFSAACASREAPASVSPQRERTDPHDLRSLRTESFVT